MQDFALPSGRNKQISPLSGDAQASAIFRW